MKVFHVTAATPQGPSAYDRQAFLIGVDFHEAAIRAGLEERDPQGAPIAALCPMIVCYAFASELYMKSLLTSRRRGHRLNMLFGHLPSNMQSEIADRYTGRTGRDRKYLDADLRAFAKAFEDWRYVFEGDGQQIQVNLLIAFTKAVYETARGLQVARPVTDFRDQRLCADAAQPTMTVANLGGGTFLHIVDGTGGSLNTPEA